MLAGPRGIGTSGYSDVDPPSQCGRAYSRALYLIPCDLHRSTERYDGFQVEPAIPVLYAYPYAWLFGGIPNGARFLRDYETCSQDHRHPELCLPVFIISFQISCRGRVSVA